MITRQTVHDPRAFAAMKDEWNELLEDSSANSLFLTWEWLHTWWRHLSEDRTLYLITLRQDERLIAVAPLALRPWRIKRLLPFRALEFIGAGNVGADYLNLIIRRGFETLALPVLVQELENSRFMLQLSQIDSSSALLDGLRHQLEQLDLPTETLSVDHCPYIDLSGHDFDSYIGGRGKSHRTNFKRRIKNLHKRYQVEFETVSDEQARADVLESLIAMHLARWDQRGGSTALHTPALRRFHAEFTRIALERNWLRLLALKLDGQLAAALYCVNYNGRYHYYQSSFDAAFSDASVGLCAIGLSIQQAISEGAVEYDFLRGTEKYKYLWADQERELVRLDVFPSYILGRFSRQMMGARQEIMKLGWHRLH